MKSLIICNPIMQDFVKEGTFKTVELDNDTITFGLIDLPDKKIANILPNYVVVKIKAFSLNFSDRALIHCFNKICKDKSGNQKYFYTGFGSDFVAEVVAVGTSVKSLKEGDRVMPDNSYPYKSDYSYGGIISNYSSQRIQFFRESELIKVPNSMTDEEAAGFGIAAITSFSFIRNANIASKQNVIIPSLFSNTSLSILKALHASCPNTYAMSTCVDETKLAWFADTFGIKDIFTPNTPVSKSKLLFDVVMDPFIDINQPLLIKNLNYHSKYLYCGYCQQDKNDSKISQNYSDNIYSLLSSFLAKRVSMIGICLGNHTDLETALRKFGEGKFDVQIDSVYTKDDIIPFLNRSFKERHIGKVIYKYDVE